MGELYQATVEKIGDFARDALADDMMILFSNMAPEEAEEYCFIHSHDELKGTIKVGGVFQIGKHNFPISAVGDVVDQNLGQLGHITIRFDARDEAEYPGCVHVIGTAPTDIEVGATLSFS
jgi:PTS system glucitol/sorbitol-specific IIA component